MGFRSYQLDEVFEFRSGLSKPKSAFGSGFPFLTFKDVFYNYFVPESLGDLVQTSEAERARGDIRRGDVFLTRTSETQDELGMSCVALRDVPNGTFNGFAKRLRPNGVVEIVPEYTAYFFRSPDFRDAITALSVPSTRASLNEPMLGRLQISVPGQATQKSIGTVLKAFDDKIDLLRRINSTLEEIARSLFQAWFVDFLPVRAKADGATGFRGLPQELFDSLPGRLDRSEIGDIPEGWEVGKVGDVVELLRQSVKPFEQPNRVFQHFSLPAHDRDQVPDLEEGAAIKSAKYAVPEGAILFSKLNPRIPRIWLPPIARGETPQIASTEFLVCLAKEGWSRSFAYALVRQNKFIEDLGKQATGTSNSHQRIKPSLFEQVPIILPPKEMREGFETVTDALVSRLIGNREEQITLGGTRDALLPKLMSGELEAPTLEALGIDGYA